MNMHVPQTLESVVELRYLASVPTQIISPQASKPVIGLAQDSMLGSFLLSQQKDLTTQETMKILCAVSAFTETLGRPHINPSGDHLWTAPQLMSMYMPDINYKGSLDINGGQVIKGILDSKNVGKGSGSLFHVTWNDYGPTTTRELFDSVAFSANTWLQIQGFSCGIKDCILSDQALKEISKMINDALVEAGKTIEKAKLGQIPKGYDPVTYKSEFPKKIMDLMDECRGKVEEHTKNNIDPDNSINTMIKCGSKGKANNLAQIASMIGQQKIEGSWIGNQLYRRALPHFCKDDLSPEAHGFVANSFMSGLSPTEYYAHTQDGRIGIITKAIKTAETGYLQRKIIKILEDLRVCSDMTVRNANNMIIQTRYGGDGFDATYIEKQDMFFMGYNMSQMCQKFQFIDTKELSTVLTPQAYKEFNESPNNYRKLTAEFEQLVEFKSYLKRYVSDNVVKPFVMMPVNFKRIILNVISKFNLKDQVVADINPVYIVDKVDNLRSRVSEEGSVVGGHHGTYVFNVLMSIYLSAKSLIYEHKFTTPAFDFLIETVYMSYLKALVNIGENVGVIAAQSIGEPTTQMTLNVFHFTGQGLKANISSGTPRLREILGLTHYPKTPIMTLYVEDDYLIQYPIDQFTNEKNGKKVMGLCADLKYTKLGDLLLRTEIYYDEDDFATCIPEDQEFIDSYYSILPEIEESQKDMSSYKWLLRLEFNRETIMLQQIPMYLIETSIGSFLDENSIEHTVIVSDDNASKLICRIKLESTSESMTDPIIYLRDIESKLLNIKIKGIEGIEKCLQNSFKKDIILPDGSVVTPFAPGKEYDELSNTYNSKKFIIETMGSNLIDVLGMPHIDMYESITNDVWEVYKIYGIEAVRKYMITEISQLFELNDSYVQERHISLLVDVMTYQGTLVSVDRHGVNKSDSGPLHRASFEETTAQLTTASIFSEVDRLTGVSGNIMFGQFVQSGTNSFTIGLDVEKIKNQTPIPIKKSFKKDEKSTVIESVDIADLCADENFEFKFKLNTYEGPK